MCIEEIQEGKWLWSEVVWVASEGAIVWVGTQSVGRSEGAEEVDKDHWNIR